MTLPPLLRLSYWFGLTPAPFLPWVEYSLLGFFAIFFFAGIALRFFALNKAKDKLYRRAYHDVSSALLTLGVFGLVLFVFSYERIYALGMRAGYLLWVALFAWYAWRLYRKIRVEIPEMQERRDQRDALNKWLPKAKM